MTDHLPSKERDKLIIELRGWHTLKGADCFRQAADEIERLREELADANQLLNSEWFQRVTYKQQLRKAQEELAAMKAAYDAVYASANEWMDKAIMAEVNAKERAAQPPPVAHNSDWCPTCTKPYAECRCNGVRVR